MRFGLFFIGLLGAQAIICGAVSAHANLDDYSRELIDKAVQYEIWHILAVLALIALWQRHPSKILLTSGMAFLIGIVLFCGSLYVKGFLDSTPIPLSAPAGGMAFIFGWILLAFYGLFKRVPVQVP